VLERMIKKDGVTSRFFDAVDLAVKESDGYCVLYTDSKEEFFSTRFACPECGFCLSSLEPRILSFTSPLGACPECNGLGKKLSISLDLVVDENKSINNDAILAYKNWEKDNLTRVELLQTCDQNKFDRNKPFKD
jgi:excinuclease ABC subunit A